MNCKSAMLALLLAGLVAPARGAIIGTNVPNTFLSAERVAGLPAWKAYYEHSWQQLRADQGAFRDELKAYGLKQSTIPPTAYRGKSEELDNPPAWYAEDEARHIADGVVSFQTPAGGWSMNTDFTQGLRAPGEMYGSRNPAVAAGTNGDIPLDPDWSYVGTFENNGTTVELRFLAKVIAASTNGNVAWKKSFFRGLEYIFAAQYPNGGWPQVWPLMGGFHDGITFNNNAMPHVLDLLQDVADGAGEFAFVPPATRARARASVQRGVACMLAAQVVVKGKPTAWCQQHDPLTLAPASARSYEMPSLAASESAAAVDFLMRLPQPDSNVVTAVHAACAWLKQVEIADVSYAYEQTGGESRKLVAVPGTNHRWARNYQIGTDKPIFGDRDGTIHDSINDLPPDRRARHAWFHDTPRVTLGRYGKWAAAHP